MECLREFNGRDIRLLSPPLVPRITDPDKVEDGMVRT